MRLASLLFVAMVSSLLPGVVMAACANPLGGAGDQIYNGDHSVMQYCNGTDWINMGGGGGVSDGDKGDITVSSSGTAWAVDAGAVTNTMLAGSIAASKLVGTDIATVGTITSGVWNAGAVTTSGALTVTGNVAVNTDKFTVAAATGNTVIAGTLNVTGTITGPGSGITALNASNLASGTVPDARFPSTLPVVSGVNLTALNASNLFSGTVNTARLGTGTADNTTYLRGDGAWEAPTGGSVPQGTWCGLATGSITNQACSMATYTSITTCTGSSVVSSCPSGYTLQTTSTPVPSGENTTYYCIRTCSKN